MILYLDTSALVKLYLEEEASDLVRSGAESSEVLATSRVAYAEALAALARRFREGDLDEDGFGSIRHALDEQWDDFAVIEVDERSAGSLVLRHPLRGFDAIHLAAALEVDRAVPAEDLRFSCFDGRLNDAARAEGLVLLEP